ncbi:type VII secretion protein EccE [Streptomyces pactum]|uniref:type VII secretion protein EccE n=1 Tax=Streptomyces pactum TaxID=68249 RepID=UPI0036F960B2
MAAGARGTAPAAPGGQGTPGARTRVRGRPAGGGSGPRARGAAGAGRSSPGPAVLRVASRPGRSGALPLQQIVLVELAAALLLVAWVTDRVLVVPAAVVAVPLVGLAVLRRRRRSLPEWLGTALAMRRRLRRARSSAVPPDTDAGLVPAVECEPALRTYAFHDRERRPVGMIGDGTFLTAVLQVEPRDAALRPPGGERGLPLALVHDALEVDGIRLESAQILQQTQPAPAAHLPPQAVATRNYAPLQAGTRAPAVRLTWVALKLDPELCPEAVAARGGGPEGAQRCLLRAADQLSSRLTGAGFRARVLSEDGVVAAVAAAACADPIAAASAAQSGGAGRAGTPVRRTVETARTWRCDDRRHTTYWLGRWPQLAAGSAGPAGEGSGPVPLAGLVSLLTSVRVLATTFSLTLSRGGRHEAVVCGHLRITARSDDELVQARRELEQLARGARTGLVRLDREQVPGVLATLPLGGTR